MNYMASISNNTKFWLLVSNTGDVTLSGSVISQKKSTIYLIFDTLNPKIPREGLTLLRDSAWALPITSDENRKTPFNKTVHLPNLAGKSVPITIEISPQTPPLSLSIDQWVVDSSFFVLGGCVSRDAFESIDAPPLSNYRARTTLVSAFHETPSGIPNSALSSNPSAFQRRMLRTDLNSQLPEILQSNNFDYLLIDLIVERTAIGQTESGGLATLSPEFIKTGLSPYITAKLDINSEQYFDQFRSAWQKLVEIVGQHRILINRVYWASKYVNGQPVSDARQSTIQNERLDKLYSIIESVSPDTHWLNYSGELLRADDSHKWGPAPYHFGKDFYQAQREAIYSALAIPPQSSKGNLSILRLPGGILLNQNTDITFSESFTRATFRFLMNVGEKASRNNALLSFDLTNLDGSPVSAETNIDGILYSDKPNIGWFFYVQTLPGTTVWQKSFDLPDGIICRKATLQRWGSDSSPIVVTGAVFRLESKP